MATIIDTTIPMTNKTAKKIVAESVKMADNTNAGSSPFDRIKHVDDNGNEYWLARELCDLLHYSSWQNFEKAIDRSRRAAANAGFSENDHFNLRVKMVNIGSGAVREQKD